MPIVGQNRKAKVHTVRNAYREAPNGPRPARSETFPHFWARLLADGPLEKADPILVLLTLLGIESPNQREYMQNLQDTLTLLREVNHKLYEEWSKR